MMATVPEIRDGSEMRTYEALMNTKSKYTSALRLALVPGLGIW